MLLRWRNDPATRAASRNTDCVTSRSHDAWLKASLENPARQLLIAETDVPVGTVRVDEDEQHVEISWTVAPEHRRHGYGTKMVCLAIPDTGRVTARIKPDNLASQKIARAAGLHLVHANHMQLWERESGKARHRP